MGTLDINQPRVQEALAIMSNKELNQDERHALLESKGWSFLELIELALLCNKIEGRAWKRQD